MRRAEGLDRDERRSQNPVATTSRRPDHIQGGQAWEAIRGVLWQRLPNARALRSSHPEREFFHLLLHLPLFEGRDGSRSRDTPAASPSKAFNVCIQLGTPKVPSGKKIRTAPVI